MRSLLEKKKGKQNVRTAAIPPQPCNTAIILGRIHSLGERVGIERGGGGGGGRREGEGNWSDFVSERDEEEEEEEVGSVFDQDGGSLQTWGPPASQDRQKPPK